MPLKLSYCMVKIFEIQNRHLIVFACEKVHIQKVLGIISNEVDNLPGGSPNQITRCKSNGVSYSTRAERTRSTFIPSY